MRVCPQRDAEGASETEIRNLQVAVNIDEQILGFKVAV